MLGRMNKLGLWVAAAFVIATPLSAEVVEQDDSGFTTRVSSDIPANPTKVWLALITPSGWWNPLHSWSGDAANMTLTPQGGGCFCETLPGLEDADTVGLAGSAKHMEVVQAMPLKVLRMRGGLGPLQSEPATGVLTITLQETGDGTRVVWEYVVGGETRYEMPVIAQAVDEVMNEQLARLTAHLGGKLEVASEAPVEEEATSEEELDLAPADQQDSTDESDDFSEAFGP